MAAALWQAAEATAPVRSSGQMAVVNAEPQTVAPCSEAILQASLRVGVKSNTELIFFH